MITARERAHLDPDALRLFDLHEKGQHAALLTEVNTLSKGGPLTPAVAGVASLSLAALERYEEAAEAAQSALAQQPRWAWLHGALAAAEAAQGRLKDAMAAQLQAAQLMAGDPAYTAILAGYQRLAGDAAGAVRTARKALLLNPEHAGALNELGLALMESGDDHGALEAFRHAQSAAPEDPAGYMNEGLLHRRTGALNHARRAFRDALRLRPGLTEAEDQLTSTLGRVHLVAAHLLTLARVTLTGWLVILFFYYLFFRLLQFLWRLSPTMLAVGQGLLLATAAYLVGGLILGRLLRFTLRSGWPR